MTKKETYKWSSNVFSVCQPDGYGAEEHISDHEERENECYEEQRRELVEIKFSEFRKGEPVLNFGKTFKVKVERQFFPKDHQEYLGDLIWEIDQKKYLNDVLAKAWMYAFNAFLDTRYLRLKGFKKPETKLTGVDSPKEYNFETDAALFHITFANGELDKIAKEVLKHPKVFDEFLRKAHGRRPGFTPFGATEINGWQSDFYNKAIRSPSHWHHDNHARACYRLFDFWLLCYDHEDPSVAPSMKLAEENISRFDDMYVSEVEDLECNGAIRNCFFFRELEDWEKCTYRRKLPWWCESPLLPCFCKVLDEIVVKEEYV